MPERTSLRRPDPMKLSVFLVSVPSAVHLGRCIIGTGPTRGEQPPMHSVNAISPIVRIAYSQNVRVVARRGEAPISVGGLLGVATHDLFAFMLV